MCSSNSRARSEMPVDGGCGGGQESRRIQRRRAPRVVRTRDLAGWADPEREPDLKQPSQLRLRADTCDATRRAPACPPVPPEKSARVSEHDNSSSYASAMGSSSECETVLIEAECISKSPGARHGQTVSMNTTDVSPTCRVRPRGGTRGATHRAPARQSHLRRE